MRLSKTESGQAAFKERSPLLSMRQRAMFILFDGQKSVVDILSATVGMGVTAEDVEAMLQKGFLAPAPGSSASQQALGGATALPLAPDSAPAPQATGRTAQQRYQDAKPLATKITAALGLRGFMLNLAVESAAGYPELLALLPKIQAVAGTKASLELERALKG